jgi:hypothetical protein
MSSSKVTCRVPREVEAECRLVSTGRSGSLVDCTFSWGLLVLGLTGGSLLAVGRLKETGVSLLVLGSPGMRRVLLLAFDIPGATEVSPTAANVGGSSWARRERRVRGGGNWKVGSPPSLFCDLFALF